VRDFIPLIVRLGIKGGFSKVVWLTVINQTV